MTHFIITIDGPSASGKSTLAKKIAQRLGINYLDSGAFYRTIAAYLTLSDLEQTDEEFFEIYDQNYFSAGVGSDGGMGYGDGALVLFRG